MLDKPRISTSTRCSREAYMRVRVQVPVIPFTTYCPETWTRVHGGRPEVTDAGRADLDWLVAELRVLDVLGIKRAASGWGRGHGAYHRALKAALAFIEQSDRGDEWAKLRRTISGPDASDGAILAPMGQALPWLVSVEARPA